MCRICDRVDVRAEVDDLHRHGHSIRQIESAIAGEWGFDPPISLGTVQRHCANHIPAPQAGTKGTTGQARAFDAPRTGAPPGVPASARAEPPTVEKLKQLLGKEPMSVFGLATAMKCSSADVEVLVESAISFGLNISPRNGLYHLYKSAPMGSQVPHAFQLVTDEEGWIEFAVSSDQHLCSKYERLDCLNEFYDTVQARGMNLVLNAGNYIDGEARFNMHDLNVHGCDNQLRYLAEHYPQREGVDTWAISGEDHEGWYARREGIDVGRYAENVMRQSGREDWYNLGFMECFLPLISAASGKKSQLCVMHPGGGSAYALSYAPQKIVEGFDGGAKPAVLVIGHYHKASYQMTRNVHVLQAGCFQDQSLFMRQKKLAAHLGGWFVRLHVDPDTGAVDEFASSFRNYFVKDFYAERWSEFGPVKHVKRSVVP